MGVGWKEWVLFLNAWVRGGRVGGGWGKEWVLKGDGGGAEKRPRR